jgi:hypothetical protein
VGDEEVDGVLFLRRRSGGRKNDESERATNDKPGQGT